MNKKLYINLGHLKLAFEIEISHFVIVFLRLLYLLSQEWAYFHALQSYMILFVILYILDSKSVYVLSIVSMFTFPT